MKKTFIRQLRNTDWKRLFRRHILAVVIFFFMTWLFMGQSLTSCNNTVLADGFGGDHIGGIIWLFTNTPGPFGGISHITNVPFGENLLQPQFVTSALPMVSMWLVSQVTGPVCAWNLMVLAGYMLSALTMYAFIYWLIRRRSIAVFAGILVSFTPYHYFKSWGHLSYLQSQLFVLLLWSCLAFWKSPSLTKSLIIGFLTGFLFYADGYFPMIGGVMLGSLLIYGVIDSIVLIYRKRNKTLLTKKLQYLFIACAVAFVMLLPVLAIQIKYGGDINASLTSSRSAIQEELQLYNARLADYFVPSETHPIEPIEDVAQNYRTDNVYSNPGEYSLYLGAVAVVLAIYGAVIFIRRNSKLTKQYPFIRWVVGACLSIIVIAGLLSFVPEVYVGDIKFNLPSNIIAQVVSFWRVYARLYLIINIAVATLAAIGLWQLSLRIKNPRRAILVIALVTVIAIIDLMPINPFQRNDEQSFVHDPYPTYSWLAQQKLPAIAAFPMIEHPFNSSYFADQTIHKTPLFNTPSPKSERELHRALSGLEDPQTLGGLKALGINNVLVYQSPDNLPGLEKVFGDYGASVFTISPSVQVNDYILEPDTTFLIPSVDLGTYTSCRQASQPSSNISIRHLTNRSADLVEGSFVLRGLPGQKVIIHDGSEILASRSFDTSGQLESVSVVVPSNKQITLYHLSPPEKGFVDVCSLGIKTL